MKRLLNIDQAAEVLNIPRDSLAKAVTARTVPFTKIGRHVRFAEHHLEAIVAAGEEPVAGAPPLAVVKRIA